MPPLTCSEAAAYLNVGQCFIGRLVAARRIGFHIDLVADFAGVAGGYGGQNADQEFFGYRQSI